MELSNISNLIANVWGRGVCVLGGAEVGPYFYFSTLNACSNIIPLKVSEGK